MQTQELMQHVRNSLKNKDAVELVFVLETNGSAPRGAGARMAVFADGSCAGTVGGGPLEKQAITAAQDLLAAKSSRLVRYTIGGAQSDTGMVCGGTVTLLFTYVDASMVELFEQEMSVRRARGQELLSIDLSPFGGMLAPGVHGDACAQTIQGSVPFSIKTPFDNAGKKPGVYNDCYLEPISNESRVFIIGCGHVGRALTEVLGFVGLSVVACDNRASMLTPELLPRATERILVDYQNLSASITITPQDMVVVCTAGHVSDFEVLEQILPLNVFYLGCLGSKKKTAHTKERLTDAGFTHKQVDSIHMPIGVPMACETPEEIAISISAQMIDAYRAQ